MASQFANTVEFARAWRRLITGDEAISPVTSLQAQASSLQSSVLSGYSVASLPAAASNTARLVYTTDGASGDAVLAFSDGTNWLRSDTRTAVNAGA